MFRRLLLLLWFVAVVALGQVNDHRNSGQGILGPFTVTTLPATGVDGTPYSVIDCEAADTCATGEGEFRKILIWSDDATAYVVVGDGTADPGAVAWGDVTGTLGTQTDLQAALDGKQNLDAALTALAAGSDFVQFSGPSGSIKAFALPDAAATILTTNALVSVAQGGTGAGTITGLLQGNGTSPITGISNSSTVGQALRVTGASTYGWGALDLADTDAVTGVLPDANVANNLTLDEASVTAHEAALAITAPQIAGGLVSDTEFDFLATITSNVQDQLDAKLITTDIDSESELEAIVGIDLVKAVDSLYSLADISSGTTAPGTCSVPSLFFDTDAAAGQNWFGCTSTNTWTLLGDGGGAGTDDQIAAEVPFTPAGNLAGTDMQAIGEELDAEKQPLDADLTTYAGITPSANIQTLLGAADYSAMRTQLALVPGTNVQAFDADLSTYAGITPAANTQTFLGAADYSAMRTQLGLVIGTNVQAFDADLTTYAGITPAANTQSLLAAANYAAMRTLLDLEAGTDFYSVSGADAQFLPLGGGTLTGSLITDNLGIEFADSDTNPSCGAGEYKVYADLSETTLKKCINGTASDLDTVGAGSFGETSLAGLVNNQTLWNGANAIRTLTADVTGATKPVFTFENNSVSLNVPFNALGGVFGDPATGAIVTASAGNGGTDANSGQFKLGCGTTDPADPGADHWGLNCIAASDTFEIIYNATPLATLTTAGAFSTASLLEGANAVPNATDHLGFFGATTSAQLAGVLSDESGDGGGFLRGTNPTITTPTISGAITFPDGVRQTFNPNGTNAGLNVGAQAGDPSTPSNGDLWYDSTANEMTARINGANVALGAGGGSSLTVEEADGTPSVGSVDTIEFDSADGFTVTDETGGDIQIDLVDASASQAGKVNTTTQTFGGLKTFANGAAFGTSGAGLQGWLEGTAPGANGTANTHNLYFDSATNRLGSHENGGAAKDYVTAGDTQTLTNKTLTAPVISTISNSGTVTLPTATDTLVGRATTDTLTNKTVDAEGTGNGITIPSFVTIPFAVCTNSTTAAATVSLPTTNPPAPVCAAEAGGVLIGTLDFDPATVETVQYSFRLPPGFTGNVDGSVVWSTTATSGDVIFQWESACAAAGEDENLTFNTLQSWTADTADAQADDWNYATQAALTMTGCAADEVLFFRFGRDADNASDTINANDVRVKELRLTIRNTF